MPDMHKFIHDLKTARDEAKLKIHLGSKEVQNVLFLARQRRHPASRAWRCPLSRAENVLELRSGLE